jgi:hypothetical protein
LPANNRSVSTRAINPIDSNRFESNHSNQIRSNQIKSDQIRSNQIKSNRIVSNRIESNRIESNQDDPLIIAVLTKSRRGSDEAGDAGDDPTLFAKKKTKIKDLLVATVVV